MNIEEIDTKIKDLCNQRHDAIDAMRPSDEFSTRIDKLLKERKKFQK